MPSTLLLNSIIRLLRFLHPALPQQRPSQLFQQFIQVHEILVIPRILPMPSRLRMLTINSIHLTSRAVGEWGYLLVLIIPFLTILTISLLGGLLFCLCELFPQRFYPSFLGWGHLLSLGRDSRESRFEIADWTWERCVRGGETSTAATTEGRESGGNVTSTSSSRSTRTERVGRVDYPRRRLFQDHHPIPHMSILTQHHHGRRTHDIRPGVMFLCWIPTHSIDRFAVVGPIDRPYKRTTSLPSSPEHGPQTIPNIPFWTVTSRGEFSHHDRFMDVCEVCDQDVRTLEVDVLFSWDRRVCFCGSAVTFFGFEGGREVGGVDCLWARARDRGDTLEDTFEF